MTSKAGSCCEIPDLYDSRPFYSLIRVGEIELFFNESFCKSYDGPLETLSLLVLGNLSATFV